MAPAHRKAFTLVELLVVIVIISMLVALLIPAVVGARARARQATCLNNQGQVAKAIMQYESSKQYLPGYVNQIGKTGTTRLGLDAGTSLANVSNLSWAVVILEELGRADLWKEWRVRTGSMPVVVLPEVLCPSDTEKRGLAGRLSYAVNCGISDHPDDISEYSPDPNGKPVAPYDIAWGLFFNHDTSRLPAGVRPTTLGLDGIADGASQTIMLSENLQANYWSDPALVQSDVGMIWWPTINSGFTWNSAVPNLVNVNSPYDLTVPNQRLFARPSSYHPGGVNAVYADGHGDFISDRIDYAVFRDQLISNRSQAKGRLIP